MAEVKTRVRPHTWQAFELLALEHRSGADVAATLNIVTKDSANFTGGFAKVGILINEPDGVVIPDDESEGSSGDEAVFVTVALNGGEVLWRLW